MTTKTVTRTWNSKGFTFKVTVEQGIWEEERYLDGQFIGIKAHPIDKVEIALYDNNGKLLDSGREIEPLPKQHTQLAQAIKAGCVGLIGRRLFIGPENKTKIEQTLAEIKAEIGPKTEEQIKLEKDIADAKAAGEAWLDSKEYSDLVEFERKLDDPNSDY